MKQKSFMAKKMFDKQELMKDFFVEFYCLFLEGVCLISR